MSQNKLKISSSVNIQNRRARFDYLILDRYSAGIVLTGTEIKSIRTGKASLTDSFCYINNGEVWMKNSYIAPYERGSYLNHSARRDRKLLLNRREINRLVADSRSPGFSIVPLRIYLSERGLAKVEIALCRGKKEYDKRASLREQQDKREIQRVMKSAR
ncbi:MAG: SsrA-binding protein SmpB [Prevotellamassilia sp.]|uniref:SsrA-binding protein SmpB n=1 Tax=Prevotellamassilia timonensis TaxID=1852370 RepID=UPI001F3E1E73|nr:SsrA-binding protein SmpB [Prevotellamassilia timonensis]MCI6069359.1 SsrA-binding protein SmpB [Bacteroidales bacterium]MDY2975854.1 SsrA-binding protein SmpB [Alloprevotella sp.]MEE1269430.1 SsrA-binding protein SmpB [Prevotellamassilia sp.]MCF2635489.1 SsrA-binding protein SmpB [Prevotellamassilia timonensis]MCI7168329.1 SsrA-binding protein SmpB [Bacteroidales bacterium]